MAAVSASTPLTMDEHLPDAGEAVNGMWKDHNGWTGANSVSPPARRGIHEKMNGDAREVARARHAYGKKGNAMSGLRARIVDHQISLSFIPLLALATVHACFPQVRHRTDKFYRLSYYDPVSDKYGIGTDDFYVVLYWILLLTGLREGAMSYILTPFARWAGIKKRKAQVRFVEQAWLFLYDASSFSLGMYIFYHSDYWLNLREMWTTWPERTMDGLLKRYYLVQFAFWLQQIIVVNIEERRKDYHQMLTHHIITCSLMFSSYSHHVTKVGNVLLCLMDIGDVILSLAKMLKYLHFQLACDVAFAVFMVSWVVARHVLYMMVVYSAYRDTKDTMPFACFDKHGQTVERPAAVADSFRQVIQPFIDPDGVSCFNPKVKWTFLGMLLALQVILLVWFGMIVRVAWRILNGGTAEDSRSDDELEAEEEEALELDMDLETKMHGGPHVALAPLEQEVGVEALDLTARAKRYRKLTAGSTGVTLPGHHSDRKELLGRIGCDKTI